MKQMFIGFSRRRKFNLVSWLVRKVEGTEFSHVYVRFPSERLARNILYEASGTSVHFKAQWIFDRDNEVVEEYETLISEDTHVSVMRFCLDNAEVPYGLKSLFGFGIVKIASIFGIKIPNPFRDGRKTYVCSELVADILRDAGFDAPCEGEATPKVLREFIRAKFGAPQSGT
jgi:hypothetical protein